MKLCASITEINSAVPDCLRSWHDRHGHHAFMAGSSNTLRIGGNALRLYALSPINDSCLPTQRG